MNQVALVGNLTRDVELRTTPSGTSVAKLRIAVNDRGKVNGEWTDLPYYFDVTVWGNQAESCAQYLSKGKKVAVSGKLTWREWQQEDGTKRQAVEVVAFHVDFLTPKGESGQTQYGPDYSPASEGFVPAASAAPGAAQPSEFGQDGDSDIPFRNIPFYPMPGVRWHSYAEAGVMHLWCL